MITVGKNRMNRPEKKVNGGPGDGLGVVMSKNGGLIFNNSRLRGDSVGGGGGLASA